MCDKCYYKVRQLLQSATRVLQSATAIKKRDVITKSDATAMNWEVLQIGAKHFNTAVYAIIRLAKKMPIWQVISGSKQAKNIDSRYLSSPELSFW